MMTPLYSLKNYRPVILFIVLLVLSEVSYAQQRIQHSFGMMAGYELSSNYYDVEKQNNISLEEKLKSNYSLGFLMGQLNDYSLINFKLGLYNLYRRFSVSIHENELDPNYVNYLKEIKAEYYIIGLPVIMSWKLYSRNNFFIRAQTGLSFEVSIKRYEKSIDNNWVSENSYRLIIDNNWKTGIPLMIGLGTDIDLSEKIRIGLYPYVNIYLKKFNPQTEADLASTFGINLALLVKP